MSYNERFRGTGVAVVTPFRDGKIDFPALTTVLNHVINGRVEHIVCLGTTGEATSLDQKEINSVLDHTIKIVDGKSLLFSDLLDATIRLSSLRRLKLLI